MTLDLTTPNNPAKRRHKPSGGRKKPMWTNPGIARNKRTILRKPPTFHSTPKDGTDTPGGEDAHGSANGADNRHEEPEPGAGQGEASTPADETTKEPAQVQILDLHSGNPIVSYNGLVYSCEWARNIGTELLFAAHEPESKLPVLRNLPSNVDLLAASSARIISKSLILEPKVPKRARSPSEPWNNRGYEPDVRIPVGYQAKAKRKDQARFLERMMDIKKAKGEKDLVTVNVDKRKTNNGWRAHWKQLRQQERSKLKRIMKRGNETEAFEAKRRLDEMDREDEKSAADAKAKGYRPDGRKLKGPGRPEKIRFSADGDGSTGKGGIQRGKTQGREAVGTCVSRIGSEVVNTPSPSTMSMPQRRDDLETGEMDDEEVEDEQLYQDEEMFDDDAPHEDGDTMMQDGWD